MASDISAAEAQLALGSIERQQQQVIAEISVPRWYWLTVAAGWAGLGVLSDYGASWLSVAATVAFGALHAAIAPRVLSGRHGSSQLSIRSEVAGRWMPLVVIGFLVVMVAVTIAIALWFNADGARHPATLAGVMVAGLVLAGGPGLVASVRSRVARGRVA